jgi:ribosome-binding protein aMBF1 (putative translation factor)
MRTCDFCGKERSLSVRSERSGCVVCSRCAWAIVEQIVQHRQHAAPPDELDTLDKVLRVLEGRPAT